MCSILFISLPTLYFEYYKNIIKKIDFLCNYTIYKKMALIQVSRSFDLIVGRYYYYSYDTIKIGRWPNETYYSSKLIFAGKYQSIKFFGYGDGGGCTLYFINNTRIDNYTSYFLNFLNNIIEIEADYDGNLCFVPYTYTAKYTILFLSIITEKNIVNCLPDKDNLTRYIMSFL